MVVPPKPHPSQLSRTLRHMGDPNGESSDDVPYQLLGPVAPEPVQDGDVDKPELLPLGQVERGQEGIPQGLGEHLQTEVVHLVARKK